MISEGVNMFASSLGLTPRRLLSTSPVTPPFPLTNPRRPSWTSNQHVNNASSSESEDDNKLVIVNAESPSSTVKAHGVQKSQNETLDLPMDISVPRQSSATGSLSCNSGPHVDMMLSSGRVVPTTVTISNSTFSTLTAVSTKAITVNELLNSRQESISPKQVGTSSPLQERRVTEAAAKDEENVTTFAAVGIVTKDKQPPDRIEGGEGSQMQEQCREEGNYAGSS